MPRDGRFFEMFDAHAEQVVAGGQALVELMEKIDGPREITEAHVEKIASIESRADSITHETLAMLHRTFITPIDRSSIHQLIGRMDDILDMIRDVAELIILYDIRQVTKETSQLADICFACCERVKSVVALLSNMKNAQAILKICCEIGQLESDADRVMRSAISQLFRDELDVRQLIKLKAIYEILETITDRCDDVANIAEGIVLENS